MSVLAASGCGKEILIYAPLNSRFLVEYRSGQFLPVPASRWVVESGIDEAGVELLIFECDGIL
jgi:hypothetical protein